MRRWAPFFVSCLFVTSLPCLAADEMHLTYMEGKVHRVNIIQAQMSGSGPDDTVWEGEVDLPGVPTIRVHFDQIMDTGGGDYEVVFRDIDYKVIGIVSSSDFARNSDYWSDWLPRGYVAISVRRLTSTIPALRFQIDKVVFGARGPKVESVVGERDFDYPASFDDERLWSSARSVAKLSFVVGDEAKTCTGFMISANELVTNEHCVWNEAICRSLLAIFGYEYDRRFKLQNGVPYHCEGIVGQPNAEADFVILKLRGDPGHKWGHLDLEDAGLRPGEPLIIVQHPSGEVKRVVMKGCEVKTEEAPNRDGVLNDFGHSCDTDTGSSGSPILSRNYLVVGLHHLGFDQQDPRWNNENRGVHSSKILASIPKN